MGYGKLQTAGVGFQAAFQEAFDGAPSQWDQVAMPVNSTTGTEEYGWLGQLPSMREWLGDRTIQAIGNYDYRVRNRDFESTVRVDRNDIDDDNVGLYGPLFREMGRGAAAIKDQLVFSLLNAGFTTACYDGQFFFDTDHPTYNANGELAALVANTDGGSGTPWFLIDSSRAIKPIVMQVRKEPEFVRKDDPKDDNVFMQRKFLYGVDARMEAAFGLWQFAWGSRQALTPTNYAVARSGLMGMKGDYGRPVGAMPDLLIVPPSLESAARKIVVNELGSGGETNEWAGTARVLVSPWLA
jgi:phage major head subunit gpT-like protein